MYYHLIFGISWISSSPIAFTTRSARAIRLCFTVNEYMFILTFNHIYNCFVTLCFFSFTVNTVTDIVLLLLLLIFAIVVVPWIWLLMLFWMLCCNGDRGGSMAACSSSVNRVRKISAAAATNVAPAVAAGRKQVPGLARRNPLLLRGTPKTRVQIPAGRNHERDTARQQTGTQSLRPTRIRAACSTSWGFRSA